MRLILLFTISVFLSSCASILNTKYEGVTIKTDNIENSIFIDGDFVGKGKELKVKLERDLEAKSIEIKREGKESKNYVLIQTHISPLYTLSVVPFGVLFFPVFFDMHWTAFDYPRETSILSPEGNRFERGSNQKYIFPDKVTYNVDKGDKVYYDKKYSLYKNRPEKKGKLWSQNNERMTLNSTEEKVLFHKLKLLLQEKLFLDTTNKILTNPMNTMLIDCDINREEKFIVTRTMGVQRNKVNFTFAEYKMMWKIKDIYNQILYTDSFLIKTDPFPYKDIYYERNSFKNAWVLKSNLIDNAYKKGFNKFFEREEVRSLLKLSDNEHFDNALTILQKTRKASNVSESVKSCVTIKTENGHGSGFYIGDNHILTCFHVVSSLGNDSVEIITNNNDTIYGHITRKSLEKDLAIIKVQQKAFFHISLDDSVNSVIGNDVYAIGTPRSQELTQTVSKGILSGVRKTEGRDLLQTDASINSGNSGGALIDKNGSLVGVVNAKLTGKSIEGIGFAIPSYEISSKLNLTYK